MVFNKILQFFLSIFDFIMNAINSLFKFFFEWLKYTWWLWIIIIFYGLNSQYFT